MVRGDFSILIKVLSGVDGFDFFCGFKIFFVELYFFGFRGGLVKLNVFIKWEINYIKMNFVLDGDFFFIENIYEIFVWGYYILKMYWFFNEENDYFFFLLLYII